MQRLKRLMLCCTCVLVAYPAGAASIVTWEGSGLIRVSNGINILDVVPPPGTPVSYTLSFDPAQSRPTPFGLPGSSCVTVPVSASVNIGGYTYTTGAGAAGYMSSLLPGSNCTGGPSGWTQFSLSPMSSPPDTPWPLDFDSLMILDYRDLIVRDAFPAVPPTDRASLYLTGTYLGGITWNFSAPVSLQAVNQMDPVPEPGTLTLFGIGLAALARKARRGHRC